MEILSYFLYFAKNWAERRVLQGCSYILNADTNRWEGAVAKESANAFQ
jgi:hypothetical protein